MAFIVSASNSTEEQYELSEKMQESRIQNALMYDAYHMLKVCLTVYEKVSALNVPEEERRRFDIECLNINAEINRSN